MCSETLYCHWNKQQDDKGILWLTFDHQINSSNIFDQEVLQEFDNILDDISKVIDLKGIVIQSGKKDIFSKGIDYINTSLEDILKIMDIGQKVFTKLRKLNLSKVALIKGICLGTGLELALSCDYRIALDHAQTQFALPEVQLGFHSGCGGTVLLPNVINPWHAMNFILSGEILTADLAGEKGLIHVRLPEYQLKAAVYHYIFIRPKVRQVQGMPGLYNVSFIKQFIGKLLIRKIRKKGRIKHYPAPYAVVNNWINYSNSDLNNMEAFTHEIASVEQLLNTDTARNLIRIFSLQEWLRICVSKVEPNVKHMHIIGAEKLGGDLAAWCALHGFEVTLEDQSIWAIAKALKKAKDLFVEKLRDPYLIQKAQDRLHFDVNGLGAKKADLIIVAVAENIAEKQKLLRRLERQIKSDAILTVNIDVIPLTNIVRDLNDPQKIIGLHFLNSSLEAPLIEVIFNAEIEQDIRKRMLSFLHKINKIPLIVADVYGFLINRILVAYLSEGVILLEEGVPGSIIDNVAVKFGMSMGPIEFIDHIGLDIYSAILENLSLNVSTKISILVNAGHLGKKTGSGFYKYKNNTMIKSMPEVNVSTPRDIADRLIMRIICESFNCLKENIIENADLLDLAVILGIGFAPFRGGPINYFNSRKEVIEQKLNRLAEHYGSRFLID